MYRELEVAREERAMKSSKIVMYLLLAWFLGVVVIIFIFFRSWAYDDPFITYRYADNLRRGEGFVYNSGERILSTTTPLFTLLLAVLGNLWGDLPHLANLLGAIGLALGGLFIWRVAKELGAPIVGWMGLLLYPTFPLLLMTLGSEMPLYIAFCLGTILFYIKQKYLLTAFCAGLAVLTRYDGLLVVLLLSADYFLRKRQQIPWKALGLFFAITLPWFLFAWLYFGSPIPVTLMVKQQQGAMYISQRFASGFLVILGWFTAEWYYWFEALLAIIGFILAFRYTRSGWLLFLLWSMIYFSAYTLLGVSGYFWYYTPLVPSFLIVVGFGVMALQRLMGRYLGVLVSIVILAALTLAHTSDLWRLSQNIDKRAKIYQAIGQWLYLNTPAEATVGTLEVGIIGYYARRPMIDFAGLIQPEVARQFKPQTTYEDAALWVVERYRPDYLVLHDLHFPRLENGYVAQHCVHLQRFEGKYYGYPANLSVYACE